MAEQLSTVFHIHPTFLSGDRDPLQKGNYVSSVEKSLGSAGFGWHMETGLHILRLFAAGVFDKFPYIKIDDWPYGRTTALPTRANCEIRWGRGV